MTHDSSGSHGEKPRTDCRRESCPICRTGQYAWMDRTGKNPSQEPIRKIKFDNVMLAWRVARVELRKMVLESLKREPVIAFGAAALALQAIPPLDQKMPHEIAIEALKRIALTGEGTEAWIAQEALEKIAETQ